ncbi:MAG: oxidoreductase [Alphaproteobacteria bacterium HGW-Alphaproteobacteria-18]|nr:MAG: oxidoreductase [Alphaproteobacteria bacterium HGW-Alphaproteobacteria-18]
MPKPKAISNLQEHPLPPQGRVKVREQPWILWLWAFGLIAAGCAALSAPFAILHWSSLSVPSPPLREFSMGLGFGGLALIALQFALTGRLRWMTHPFGADIVYLFHRYMSRIALGLVIGHFLILYIWFEPELGDLNPLTARWELTSGRLAMACFIGLIISSEFRKRLRLRYEWWRYLHVALAVTGFAAAIAHVLGVDRYTADPGQRALWIGVTISWAALLIWSRALRPWLQSRNPWQVVSNTHSGGGVHTLELAPLGKPLKKWKAGQFAWLSIGRSPFALKEHPFTISTAPDHGPNLTFSIKALGDDTARLIETSPGTIAYVDGPYGGFSVDRKPDAAGFIMIAGGVGITPIISNLHALAARNDPRPIILIYTNSDEDSIAFKEELEHLSKELNLKTILYLDDPPQGWEGQSGRVNAESLKAHLPEESRDWPYFLCGPKPMVKVVVKALNGMGTPARHIDSEVFELV